MSGLRIAGISLGLSCALCGGTALAEEAASGGWAGIANRFADRPAFSALDLRLDEGGADRLPVLEITTLHRPSGGIDLLARTTAAGSLAGVIVMTGHAGDWAAGDWAAVGGAGGDTATVSILTLSTPEAENATTVHAITQTADGPLFAAATTRWDALSGREGTAAYAMLARPEGAVFQATGDLASLTLRPWTDSQRRERVRKPVYAWGMPAQGRTDVSFFVRTVNGHVTESTEGGIDVDLAETVSGARLPAISIAQMQTLQASAFGVQAGLGLSRDLRGGLSLWTQIGVGLHRVEAGTRVLHLSSVDQAAATGVGDITSVTRVLPSALLSVGLSQAFDDRHTVSVYLAAEADSTPALAVAGDGPAVISFTARRGVTIGLSMKWQF